MHWYRSREADQFEAFVKELVRAHRLPVWFRITFRVPSFTKKDLYFGGGLTHPRKSSMSNIDVVVLLYPKLEELTHKTSE